MTQPSTRSRNRKGRWAPIYAVWHLLTFQIQHSQTYQSRIDNLRVDIQLSQCWRLCNDFPLWFSRITTSLPLTKANAWFIEQSNKSASNFWRTFKGLNCVFQRSKLMAWNTDLIIRKCNKSLQEDQHPLTGQHAATYFQRGSVPLHSDIKGMELPLPIYWYHSKGNWLRYNFAADSFYFCSRLLVLYCRNCAKDDKFRYLIPVLRKLGAA